VVVLSPPAAYLGPQALRLRARAHTRRLHPLHPLNHLGRANAHTALGPNTHHARPVACRPKSRARSIKPAVQLRLTCALRSAVGAAASYGMGAWGLPWRVACAGSRAPTKAETTGAGASVRSALCSKSAVVRRSSVE